MIFIPFHKIFDMTILLCLEYHRLDLHKSGQAEKAVSVLVRWNLVMVPFDSLLQTSVIISDRHLVCAQKEYSWWFKCLQAFVCALFQIRKIPVTADESMIFILLIRIVKTHKDVFIIPSQVKNAAMTSSPPLSAANQLCELLPSV